MELLIAFIEFFVLGISFLTSYSSSPHTSDVVDAVVDALTSQSPRDRYLVGLDARFMFVWLARLPTSVADFILARLLFKGIVPLASK